MPALPNAQGEKYLPLPDFLVELNRFLTPPASYALIYHSVLSGELEARRNGRVWELPVADVPKAMAVIQRRRALSAEADAARKLAEAGLRRARRRQPHPQPRPAA
jgi:hypothetical protein